MLTTQNLTAGEVVSRDGTRIGYLTTGTGPAVVLLHGSMESARSHLLLADALADEFTVYLPDRRGRGLSGPHRPDHAVRTEVEDLEAVLERSGATRVFGVSAGGVVVLEAARIGLGLRKVAAYEPALALDAAPHKAWLARFDKELAQGKVGAAMVTSMFGLDLAPAALRLFPRRLLAAMTEKMLTSEEKKAGADAITMRQLAPTIHYEGALIAELAGRFESFGSVEADVLLMGGSKGLPFLRPGRDLLSEALPHVRRVELDGLDHGSTSDPSPTNSTGSAEAVGRVAAEIRTFFSGGDQ